MLPFPVDSKANDPVTLAMTLWSKNDNFELKLSLAITRCSIHILHETLWNDFEFKGDDLVTLTFILNIAIFNFVTNGLFSNTSCCCHMLKNSLYFYLFYWHVLDSCMDIKRTSKFRELWSPARQQIWPWSRSKVPARSRRGNIGKALSQRTHMPSIKALPVIVQKLRPRLKFLWQTDTDGQTDRRMWFNVPALSLKRGTKRKISDSALWQKPFIHRIVQKTMWQHKNATKNRDYTTNAGRLRTVSWNNKSHPTGAKNFPTTRSQSNGMCMNCTKS